MASISERLAMLLAPAGISIVHPFSAQSYNIALQGIGHPEWSLPEYGRTNTLALIIGTNVAVWKPFTEFVRKQGWLEGPNHGVVQHPHPFDEYLDLHLFKALQSFVPPLPQHDVRFHNDTGAKFVHLLLAGHASGLAYHNKKGFFCVHPVFGPWFSMRCVITFDAPGPDTLPPEVPNPHPLGDEMVEAVGREVTTPPRKPWTTLLKLRQVLGDFESARAHVYVPAQIRYHYTGDRAALLE